MKRVLALCVLLLLGIGIAQVWAEQMQALPQIVLLSPTNEIALDAPITMMFNQAMNRQSVETAWSLEPAVAGSFHWDNDYTLLFQPAAGWAREMTYTVKLSTAAMSSAEQALAEEYSAKVKTVGYLHVSSVQPEADTTEVLADAKIVVAFNRPVVPLVTTGDMDNLPHPLMIEPAVSGRGEWLNTFVYQFIPDQPLAGATTYTVTVRGDFTDLEGTPMAEAHQWQFTTILPQIVSVYPYAYTEGIALDSPVTVNFSQPMDRAATEQGLQLRLSGLAVAGTFAWSDDNTQVTFTPTNPLLIATPYQIVIDQQVVRSITGATLREGYTSTFDTVALPYVAQGYPNEDYRVYPGWQSIRVSFGTRMDAASVAEAVTIEPKPAEITTLDNSEYYLTQEFEFLPKTTYTVTVKGTARDIYGNTLGNDYRFSFTVQDIPQIESAVQQALSQRFLVTGAYRRNTSVAVRVAGQPTFNLALYRLRPENIWYTFNRIYGNFDTLELMGLLAASEKVREWTERLDPATDYAYMRVNLAGEQGGALPAGVYLVTGLDRYSTMLAVTNSNITVKRVAGELFIWVTDMQTGAPLPNQTVSLYHYGDFDSQGVTDQDGLLRLPISYGGNDLLTIVSQDSQFYGVWRSYAPSPQPVNDVYLYTDRPIYRPGETLYYRGTYRQRDDMHYFVNNQNQLNIQIRDARGEMLLDQPLTLNEFGSFSGEIELPDTVATGSLYLYVNETDDDYQQWYLSAQVAEYRVPEYKVSVTGEQPELATGDTLRAVVNTAYFSGGTVSNATVNWTVTSTPTSFRYTGKGRYSFIDWLTYEYDYNSRQIMSSQATTDAAGSFLIEIPQIQARSMYPESLLIEASISDESGQAIAGRTTALLHGTDTYIGVRTVEYFARENQPFTAEVITVARDSAPLANELVTVKLLERRWERNSDYNWYSEDIEVASTTLTTNQEGKATYEFTAPNPGIFMVVATNEKYRSSTQIYVSGNSRYVRWGNAAEGVTLIPDKEVYSPAETAQIFMQIPYEGTSWALITVERAGVMQYEVVKIEGSNLLYSLPITAEHEPGISVSVMLMHGIDANNPTPAYAQQTITLKVEPVSKRLNLTISPSTTNAKPGDVVTLDILALDGDGNPVKAEFGLMLVDAAILSLTGSNSQNPEAHYYSNFNNQTSTDLMLQLASDRSEDALFGGENVLEVAINVTPTPRPPEYAPQLPPTITGTESLMMTATPLAALGFAGGGGNGGLPDTAGGQAAAAPMVEEAAQSKGMDDGVAVDIRGDFQQTPLWAAHVITDANGRAQVSVTMPDNLTIWNLTARAITSDTLIGEVKLDIASTLPLLVRPVVPRFFVVGDEVTLGMVINNNTDQPQDVRTELQGSGYTLVGNTTAEQNVLVPPQSRARVDWRVKIADVEGVDLTFVAIGNDGFQDASKPPLAENGLVPVYRYTTTDIVGTAGVVQPAETRLEGVIIPPIADDGTLTIKIDHSLAASTLDSLTYLQNYPHQCIEQTVSRFLPNLVTMRALQKLNVANPELDANLSNALDYGVGRLLLSQNYDGGWGWFPQMESNPYVTAYALLGLVEAQDFGYEIPQYVIDNAVEFIRQQLIIPNTDSSWWQLNRQAFFFYVMTKAAPDYVRVGELDKLLDYRVEMSIAARAYLLMAYVRVGGDAQIQTLTNDLKSAAFVSATGAHWEETSLDWWNWGSDVRTTSLVVMALLQTDPNYELLPNAIRWLMVARRGDHWESTQETTWAVMALTDWMVTTHELEGNYSYSVAVNDVTAAQEQVSPATIRDSEVLTFAVQDLLMEEMNRITISRDQGQGMLYYTTHLQLDVDASAVEAINRGIGIQREFLLNGQNVTSANVGDVITVRLTVNVPETIYYVVLESPIPAGTEAVDYSLQTTAQSSRVYDAHYYWYYWLWDHQDIRDEALNLYADVLYPGTYVYSYEIRASVAGAFQVMPTDAFAFYFPEVFGRSDGALFTVK